jgi:16S rRNA (cytosine967-C5)-methyltransferase
MRLHPAVVGHTENVLREILRFAGPADVTLSRYFRENPRLGGRERGVIAESVLLLPAQENHADRIL